MPKLCRWLPASNVALKIQSATTDTHTEREMAEAASVVPAEGGGDDTAKVELLSFALLKA